MKKALILTEAGKNIGLGHYTRCTSLANELRNHEVDTELQVFVNEFDLKDQTILIKDWLNSPKALESYHDYDLAIIDSYLAPQDFYQYLKTLFKYVWAIDDFNRIPYPVDTLLNPNVFFDDIDYSNQSANCLGGKDFVILRSEFRLQEIKTPTNKSISQVFITLGGSDYRQILSKVVSACLKIDIDLIKVVVPNSEDFYLENERLLTFPILDAVALKEQMIHADVVLSACGQTLHELAALGKPSVGICLDVDQIPNQRYYLNSGFLEYEIHWNDHDIEDEIINGINSMVSLEKRIAQQKLSTSLFDSDGVSNLVSFLISALDE